MASNISLTGLAGNSRTRFETGNSIQKGLIGSGEMGPENAARASRMPGIDISAIAGIGADTACQETGSRVVANPRDARNAAVEQKQGRSR